MNCDKVRRLLVDYSEELLAEGKRRAVEEHVLKCQGCRSELVRIERVRQDLLSLEAPAPEAPARDAEFWERFSAKLSRRLPEEGPAAARRRLSWQAALPLAAAVAVAVLVMVSLVVFMGKDSGRVSTLQLADEASGADSTELAMLELEALDEEAFIETFLARADFTNGELEEYEDEMFSLIEDDLLDLSEEMITYDIYEQSIYDYLDDLSEEELEDVYESLASI